MAGETSVVEYAGTPIAELGRYSGDAITYQDVVSWEVPTGKTGVVFEVSIITNNFAKTQIRLQFKKPLTGTLTFVYDSKVVTGSGTAFKSELAAGDKIILDADEIWAEVDSITNDASLTLKAKYTGTGGNDLPGSKVWGFQDKYIQVALSLPWNDNKLAAGIEVKWQAKSTVTLTGTIVGGPFTVGEIVTGSISSASGTVVDQGADYIVVGSITGTFVVGDTVTGADSGASINGTLTISSTSITVDGSITGKTLEYE